MSFDESTLAHDEAVVDQCLARGVAPVVASRCLTSPHWFALRSSRLDPAVPDLFARYCDAVVERFGDRIAVAVTMNEPNLPRLLSWRLSWLNLPSFIRDVERATLEAASKRSGVPAYRLANMMLPRRWTPTPTA